MLLDGHELDLFTATFTAMANPGTFTAEDLAAYAHAYTGRERLREGFAHYRALLDDGLAEKRALSRANCARPQSELAATSWTTPWRVRLGTPCLVNSQPQVTRRSEVVNEESARPASRLRGRTSAHSHSFAGSPCSILSG
ncbi:hypothetical protein [Streptomyces microflavus]